MKEEVFCIRLKKGIGLIEKDKIIYCKAAGRYTFLITQEKKMKIACNIKNIEQRLCKKKFLRIHRSHIVNQGFIKEYLSETNEIILTNGDKFSISLRKKNIFLKWFRCNNDE